MASRWRRVLLFLLTVSVMGPFLGVLLLGPEPALDGRFAAADCRRIALTDPRTGAPVVGVEDLALAPDGDTVILSAHDRFDPAAPGGLYALGLGLLGGDGPAALLRLDAPRDGDGLFRPHGIAIDPESGALAVVNRPAPGRARVEVGSIGPTGWSPDWVVDAEGLCRANDLDFDGGALFVTLDRADCATSLRDLSPWSRTGTVAQLTPETVTVERRDLAFPNGLSRGIVAETRAGMLTWPNGDAMAVPGGPDNILPDGAGGLTVAVHPNLPRLFLTRQGLFERAPSRIVRIAPGGGRPEILFDDPAGEVFSGATVGLLAGRRLLVGSATDEGLLLCEARQ